MRRRKFAWLSIPAAVILLVATLALRPRHDPYAFLRHLHPVEHLEQDTYAGTGGRITIRERVFRFAVPYKSVYECVSHHWPLSKTLSNGPRTEMFEDPSGRFVMLSRVGSQAPGITCSLVISEGNPTWLERQIDALERLLHRK